MQEFKLWGPTDYRIGLYCQGKDEWFGPYPKGDYGILLEGREGWEKFKEFIEALLGNGQDIAIPMPNGGPAFWLRQNPTET